MLRELLATPGVVEVCELRSRFGFMAFHGGSLEETTDVIASRAAAASGASYYGVLQPPDLNWHIPSTKFVAEESTTLASFFDHVEIVITVHGYGRDGHWATVLLGGANRELAEHIGTHVRPRLPAYDIVTDLERIPIELRGLHERNPVNVPRLGGVQIELPPRVRGSSALWADWEGPDVVPHAQSLIDALTNAALTWAR